MKHNPLLNAKTCFAISFANAIVIYHDYIMIPSQFFQEY